MPPAASITPAVKSTFETLGNALVGNGPMPLAPWHGSTLIRTESYFHRLNITSTANTLTFFQGTYSDFVTNLPQAGYLGGDNAMWLCGLAFTIQKGYQVDGTAEADGEAFQTDADPSTVAADMQALIDHGLVELKIGSQVLMRRYGLFHFPSGGGVSGFASNSNTNTTTINHLAVTSNGAPSQQNKHRFTPPHPIFPNDQIVLTLRYPFSRTLKDNYVIQADLEGVTVGPR